MKMRIKQTVALVIEARNECNRLEFEAVAKLYGRDLVKKLALILILVFSILAVAAPALASVYVGNLRSYKFHYQGCRGERMMAEHNRIYFYSRDEALDCGMVPCQICRP